MKLKYKEAFTFAEFLIVLFAIGIIAIIVIPRLKDSINQKGWGKAQNNFEEKLADATKQMNAAGVLPGYFTNDAFVDVFSNYTQITKRCGPGELNECFAPIFKTKNGEVIFTSGLKTGRDLGHMNNKSALVGVQFWDKISAIIAFDPDCQDLNLVNSPSKHAKDFPSEATTSCISMLYDVNGLAKPNIIGKDIQTLNASITSCDGTKINNICVGINDTTYSPSGIFIHNSAPHNNWWMGATIACEAQGMRLPTKDELNIMYRNRSRINGLSKFAYYWSATVQNDWKAWAKSFSSGGDTKTSLKSDINNVRCVK